MKRLLTLTILTATIVLRINAAEMNPDKILEDAIQTYENMTSIKADGDIVSSVNMNSNNIDFKTTCTILLAKPDLYKITWSQKTGFMNQDGAVWNAGDAAYLYMGILKAYSKFDKDEIALAGATGISAGAANTIPSLFRQTNSFFQLLKNCKYIKEEKINAEMCHVIQGDSPVGLITLWISKSRLLLIQIKKDMGKKPVTQKFDMNDKQIADALKAMGKEPTEKNITKMKNRMKMAAEMTKSVKAVFTETYKNIVINKQYKEKNFVFTPPADTKLKKNLLGNAFSGNK